MNVTSRFATSGHLSLRSAGKYYHSRHPLLCYNIKFCRRHLNTPRNKSPGGSHQLFSRPISFSIMTRIPASILLLVLFNHEDISIVPFAFDFMAGPSMLPTIYPVGDIYIRFNSWFMKLWNGRDKWQVGDVVVFKDPRGNHSCKRIIGIEGDQVDKRGQYVHLYQDEQDLGIRKVPTIDVGDWEDKLEEKKGGQGMVIVVPKGTVWVEGDNPLFSVDSRHYGPISNDSILGKVVYRLWPRHRNIEGTEKKTQQPETKWSCLVNPRRPHPMREEEMFSGLYNIAKIPVKK